MKFEFSLAVKAVPMADVKVSVDCSAEELAIALADPVYQRLGEVLATKLSQAQRQEVQDRQDNRKANHQQNHGNDRFDRQANQHRQQAQARDEAIMSLLKTISSQLDRANHRNF